MNKNRTLLFSLLFLIISCHIFAQKDSSNYSPTSRGRCMLGGDVSVRFQKQTTYNSKNFSTSFSPKIAYFILKNLALGLNVNYHYQNTDKGDVISEDVAVGTFLRYYVRFKKHGFFAEGGVQYGKSKITYENPYSYYNQNSSSTFEQFSFGGGYCYFLNKNVSLEAVYQFNKRSLGEGTFPYKQNIQTVMMGLQFYF